MTVGNMCYPCCPCEGCYCVHAKVKEVMRGGLNLWSTDDEDEDEDVDESES